MTIDESDQFGHLTCGQAIIRLLGQYGVDTVFGIPGVHTLELYRGLKDSSIRHVQARNEQGAGFMADGYARVSGKPGVAMVISGPGVTNALTAIGQSYADSVPLLLISSDAASHTLGKGWGCLHEVESLIAVSKPLTAMSVCIHHAEDIPGYMAQAFEYFASARPRPVHFAIPTDILAQPISTEDLVHWQSIETSSKTDPSEQEIYRATELLVNAKTPIICVGGGARSASDSIKRIAEKLDAAVVTSIAGKGILADSHPLNLGSTTMRRETRDFMANADLVLAIGTELAETDSFVDKLELSSNMIRVDLDGSKIDDLYPATVGIVADAKKTADQLLWALASSEHHACANRSAEKTAQQVAKIKQRIGMELNPSEQQHAIVLNSLNSVLPDDCLIMGDICQLVYTGAFVYNVRHPRLWHYPAGYCTLGCALPNAIGAKLAFPNRSVICLAGDGGAMFTIQELVTAAELNLSIPMVIWNNGGFKQIKDDMRSHNISPVGVNGVNPNFIDLAHACHCEAIQVNSKEMFEKTITSALQARKPTVIEIRENDDWLIRSDHR